MSLQTALDQLASSTQDHILGIVVTDLQAQHVVAAINPERMFQLASIFKIPVLVTAFRHVDESRLSLDARFEVRREHKLIGSGVLSFLDAGLQPTLRDLLTLMIIASDNTATDIVLDLLGGPDEINVTMHRLGIKGINIRQTTRDLLWAVFPSDELVLTEAEFAQYTREHNLARLDHQIAPDAATNTGTPASLNALLTIMDQGDCASPESTRTMFTILKRQTFNRRLPRTWPEEIEFAHKTGTIGDMRGDCGILYLPDKRRFAISVLVQACDVPLPLTNAQQEAGDSLLARIGEVIFAWATGS